MQQNNFYVWAMVGLFTCGEVRSADNADQLIADLERSALPGATHSHGSSGTALRQWETRGNERVLVKKHMQPPHVVVKHRRPDTPYLPKLRIHSSTSSSGIDELDHEKKDKQRNGSLHPIADDEEDKDEVTSRHQSAKADFEK